MKIYYQWHKWAYSHKVWLEVAKKYKIDENNIIWLFSFKDVFDKVIEENWIWIVPIENSYAGSVHENFYHLVSYKVKIIWEYYLDINHCIASTGKNLEEIEEAYSHYQALMQCEQYLKKHKIKPHIFWDTAWSAKYIKNKNNPKLAAISSEFAAEIYGLNILEKNINDQKWNTTRFFIVVPKNIELKKFSSNNKISLVFKVKNMPAVLYKCLWAFATRNIDLTRIESLPTKENKFEYMFWVDFIKPSKERDLEEALKELSFFSKDIKVLWKY